MSCEGATPISFFYEVSLCSPALHLGFHDACRLIRVDVMKSDDGTLHPDAVHQPGGCVVKGTSGRGEAAGTPTGVILFNGGFTALSYFHVATSDDYIFVGADDEVISFDAQATVTHDAATLPKIPAGAVLLLGLPDEKIPECPAGIWYYDPQYFKYTCVSSSAGNLNIVTELPTENPIGLNVLVTRRCVRILEPKPEAR